jgi:transposase, IS6 family
VDASCIWRWVQAYAPELNKRCRPHLRPANKSYRIDETYIKVKGSDKYLYRAVDSTGQTIDFLLTTNRDKAAAKRFLRNAIEASGNAMPRVMNVEKNPAYPAAADALKADGVLPRRVALRRCKYLNNVIEQDHRTVKKRVWLAKLRNKTVLQNHSMYPPRAHLFGLMAELISSAAPSSNVRCRRLRLAGSLTDCG